MYSDSARAVLCPAAWCALVGAAACKERPAPPAAASYGAMRMRRLLQPPPGGVRAVPPHAIHADGVGPYVLGTSLREVLGMLSRGPRVTLVQIDGVVDYSLVRAESGALIIGVEPLGTVAFVSVLDAETARTDAGIGVGATSAELAAALGPRLAGPALALPPRIAGFASLPNVRFLLDPPGGQIAAVVVRRPRGASPGRIDAVVGTAPVELRDAGVSAAGAAVACPPGDALAGRVEEIARAAEVMRAEAEASLTLGCFSGAAVEALVYTGDRVVAVGAGPGPEPGALRRLAVHDTLGVSFAAPLDVDGDGRSEIAVVEQAESEGERRVNVAILRLENNRFTPLAGSEVYRLSERSAAWVGAHLPEIELLVELRATAGDVLVSGLYAHRGPAGQEGLNAQIYNRCIGTRFCGSACPYKAWVYKWFDPVFPQPLAEQLNPDVSVRTRGIMEKCTFCFQRIRRVGIETRAQGRKPLDGEIQPACVQTCPPGALIFGDLNNPDIRASQGEQPSFFSTVTRTGNRSRCDLPERRRVECLRCR